MPKPRLWRAEQLGAEMANAERPIAAAWSFFERRVMPPDAPLIQRTEMRKAFFAGASILFEAIMAGLDPGTEPTEADMRRMDRIAAEVSAFAEEMAAQHGRP